MSGRPELSRPTGIRPLDVIDPLSWQDQPLPERRWLVDGLIPLHNVTMLGGDGGLGKSLLALQLLSACALGKPWLGRSTLPCKALGIFCEDDGDELHRRLGDVCRHYDAEFGDLENLQLTSRVGLDNALMEWKSQWEGGEVTGLHSLIMNFALDFGAQVVVLDSLHDVFAGNENARPQARQFINALRTIATEIDGAVVLTSHPSLSGRNSGTGEAGSTAWNNAVRSRLYLVREDDAPQDERVLKTMKANYSPLGNEITLKWQDGVFAPDHPETGVLGSIEKSRAENTFLEAFDRLAAQGQTVNTNSNQPNYAPKLMAKMGLSNGIKVRDLENAMFRLLNSGDIKIQRTGPPARQRISIVRADAPTGG